MNIIRFIWRHKLAAALLVILCASACAQTRIQPPDFDVPYELPPGQLPLPRTAFMELVDVAVLVLAMALAAVFVIRLRSRKLMFVLAIAALAYFGFYRKGCICSIGAIQNVTLALGDANYVVPMTVILFLALPMVFALLFGRVFCGGACPLGMIQEVVLIKPVRVPPWLANGLGVFPFLYLGLAVMLAFTGTAFIICQHDPFVGFFRLSGSIVMLGSGVALLVLGVFVGRPYCRFMCPYGAVLGLLSRVSWKHVTITPEDCVVCGLCEDACPYGAIDKPTPRNANGSAGKNRHIRKAFVFALVFILPLAGAGLGAWAGPGLARTNATVILAQRIQQEEAGVVSDYSFESEAFRTTGRPVSELYAQARQVEHTFMLTGAVFGAWVGLVFALKFFGLNRSSARSEFVIRNADCVSCGRCLKACPTERAALKRVSAMASSTRSPE